MKKAKLFLSLALLASCTEAELFEPPVLPTKGIVRATVTPQGITGLTCILNADGTKSPIIPGVPTGFLGSTYYYMACTAPDYEDATSAPFYLRSVDTLAIGLNMVHKPIAPPPAPTMGVVKIEALPQGVAATTCSIRSENDSVKVGPLPARTAMSVPGSKYYEPSCIATGYQNTKGQLFYLKVGDTTVVSVAMIPITPTPQTTADVWVSANVASAKVDSMVRYTPTRVRSSVTVGSNTPYRTTVTADGSLYQYWVSAPGYYPDFVTVAPVPGELVDRKINLTIIPPPPVEPPTNGELSVVSWPTKMKAKVSRISAVNGTWVTVADVTTDTVLTAVLPGHYRAECTDASGKYLPAQAFISVNAGVKAMLFCPLAEKIDPPPPPPSPSVSLVASPRVVKAGELVTVTVSGSNVTGIIVSPFGVTTLGGTFSDHPTETTNYCAFGFGPGGTVSSCQTVQVTTDPPPPPPTTGTLAVSSTPTGMRATVRKLGGAVVFTGTTNFEREFEAGFYTVLCEDLAGKYLPFTTTVAVNVGLRSTAVCTMVEKENPPPPPPTTGTLVVTSTPTGMKVTISRTGTSSVVGTTRFEGTFNVGAYTVVCEDPAGKYLPFTINATVNPGVKTEVNCPMVEKPPVTGILRIVSDGECVEARVYLVEGNKETLVKTVSGNTSLTLPIGTYRVKCSDPERRWNEGSTTVNVEAGKTVTATCHMERRKDD